MKKEPELTPWFPATEKPVRAGWYERDWHKSVAGNDYWDGFQWRYGGGSDIPYDPAPSNREWRGLTSKATA